MKILEAEKFKKDLDFIVRYIARDKRVAAIDFAKKLKNSINELTTFPANIVNHTTMMIKISEI